MRESPSALVIGAGAIGTVLAAHLWKQGVPVEVLTKPAEAAAAADANGLTTEGIGGTFTARPRVVSQASDLSLTPDVVFLVTKAMHVSDALAELASRLTPSAAVVVMQNGYCEEEVARLVGGERVVSCTVKWGASLVGHAHSRRTSAGGFAIGSYDGASALGRETLATVAAMLAPSWPVHVTQNVVGARHAKLIFNACATGVGAVCGENLRGIVRSHYGRKAFLHVATEAVDVCLALGIRLEPIDGLPMTMLHIGPRRDRGGFSVPRLFAEVLVRIVAWRRGEIVSSMLQSLRRGEPTEVAYLNGYIVRKAAEVGVDAPVNRRLVEVVGEIERGQRAIHPRNLAALFSKA